LLETEKFCTNQSVPQIRKLGPLFLPNYVNEISKVQEIGGGVLGGGRLKLLFIFQP